MPGLEENVMAFVAAHRRMPQTKLTPGTTLFGDLGIDGIEGDDILAAFQKQFGVDMSEARLGRHFGDEGVQPWTPIYWLVLAWRRLLEKGSTPESRARLLPITLQDLIDSAQARKWSISYETDLLRLSSR